MSHLPSTCSRTCCQRRFDAAVFRSIKCFRRNPPTESVRAAGCALQILNDRYASEIDWSICTWWDGGYFATLGQSAPI